MKYPKFSGFVGYKGDSVWLTPLPDDHPMVRDLPDVFKADPAQEVEKATPARRRPGRSARKAQPPEPTPFRGLQPDPPPLDDADA
jgi:hypothetical protein